MAVAVVGNDNMDKFLEQKEQVNPRSNSNRQVPSLCCGQLFLFLMTTVVVAVFAIIMRVESQGLQMGITGLYGLQGG